jgi:hypothetical protein
VSTHDAGRTWSLVATMPPSLIGDSRAVSELRFADALDGWAFAPQLWATHDGGRSWHELKEAQPVADVEASAGQAYALIGSHLLRTAVGSDSWQPVSGVPTVTARAIALHGRAVWLAGGGPGAAKLVASSDGVSWRNLADPCATLGADWALAGVAPVTATGVYLLCGGDAGAGSESKKVLFSNDGGATTKPTAGDPPRGGDVGEIAASQAAVAVSARSGASWVYRSGDSGATWGAALQQGDGGIGYFDLGFTTATQGVVVYGQPGAGAPTKLLMTRDAGLHWAQVSF